MRQNWATEKLIAMVVEQERIKKFLLLKGTPKHGVDGCVPSSSWRSGEGKRCSVQMRDNKHRERRNENDWNQGGMASRTNPLSCYVRLAGWRTERLRGDTGEG